MKIWQENDAKITKMIYNLKTTQNDEKMHYKITIFGACTPYPRLIYWIASSILQEKCHQNLGPGDHNLTKKDNSLYVYKTVY